MGKTFVCSLCRNGIIGGGLYIDEQSVTSSPNNFIDATLDKSRWMPISAAFPFRYCTRKNESLSIYRPVIKLGSSVSAQRSICIASSEEFDRCFFICRRAFSSSSDVIPNFNCPILICGSTIISSIIILKSIYIHFII